MNRCKKVLAAAVATVCMAGGVASTAQAGILATAFIDMTNFEIKRQDTGAVLANGTDITNLAFTSSGDADAKLGGATDSDQVPNSTTGIDIAVQCVGTCPQIGENVFPVLTGAPTENYATADQLESGSPITGTPGYTGAARVASGAYAGIAAGDSTASANSNNGLEANWEFTANFTDELIFEFDVRTYLEAFVGAGEKFPGKASGGTSFNFTISDADGNEVWNALVSNPAALNVVNRVVSLNAPTSGARCYGDIGGGVPGQGTAACGNQWVGTNLTLVTPTLTSGVKYQLTARMNANVDIARVPEPGMLSLLGIGLVGFGLTSARARRRAVKSA